MNAPDSAGEEPVPTTVADMVAGLGTLPKIMLSTDAIDEVIWKTATLAVQAADDVDACGVTVVRDGGPISLLRSEAEYSDLEELQYAAEDGPAMQAMRERKPVLVTAMDDEHRWGDYPGRAAARGVGSSMSIPLIAGEQVLGSLNFYAKRDEVFGPSFVLGQLVADLAASALWCLLKHADKQELGDQLEQVLTSREVIDQAKGILIAQQGCDADGAFKLLRQASQNRNVKLRDIAAEVVSSQAQQR
ncbi:GAF and ANTAR domain-containing protein [Prauserella alba]|uniref:GAF and ANTAR domain-containing protein n=1 Tax=Prauserella alba TaxID=176898 RepID=A0ABP4G1V4_9PSEU|nr:GAF and ANTAR domain-containing protein [Prauserella alba]MCP2182382.1 GAF domain-containing protein [Prauserella alba]